MPERVAYQLLCLLLVLAVAVPASAVKQSRAVTDEDVDEEEAAQSAEPAPSKQVMHIEVKDNFLNVEVENVDFGSVIRSIADKAKFKIEGSGAVFGKKLNTKFSDIEIDRGVTRLLTLVKESNYMLHYDATGAISKLEILSATPGTGIRPPTGVQPIVRPQMPSPLQPPRPANIQPLPAQRPVPVPVRPAAPPPRPVRPQITPDEDGEDDEDVEEIPHTSPQPMPRFSPKKE